MAEENSPSKNSPLIGVLDHFYSTSVLDQDPSNLWVSLCQCADFKSNPRIALDSQHGEFIWFDPSEVSNDSKFHP